MLRLLIRSVRRSEEELKRGRSDKLDLFHVRPLSPVRPEDSSQLVLALSLVLEHPMPRERPVDVPLNRIPNILVRHVGLAERDYPVVPARVGGDHVIDAADEVPHLAADGVGDTLADASLDDVFLACAAEGGECEAWLSSSWSVGVKRGRSYRKWTGPLTQPFR